MKLNEYGWADNDVLANFIVVMVANDKSKVDIIAELNDILPGQAPEFVDWLFENIDGLSQAAVQQAQDIAHAEAPVQSHDLVVDTDVEHESEPMETTLASTRQRPSTESRAPGRLLQSAISGATRTDVGAATPQLRQAPSRVYEDEKRQRERRVSRDKSLSPVRAKEGLTTKGREDRIRFRRTSVERANDEARIEARLGPVSGGGDKDRLRGRLGRIEDRLGKRGDDRIQPRERSWDRGNDYHDRRGGRNANNNRSDSRRGDAMKDIDRRLGTRPANGDNNLNSIPHQPASWSRNPEKMLRVEAEITRQAVVAESANITRCRFWPNCTQGDLCQYWHPRELCTDFPNCSKTADTCLFIHPLAEPTAEQVAAAARQVLMQSMRNSNVANKNGNGTTVADEGTPIMNALQMPFALGSQTVQECKFGARCTRPDCKFRHPQKDMNQQVCRFFPHCTKPNCPFFHPPYGEPLAGKDTTMDESGAGSGSANGEAANRLSTPCRFGDQCTRPGCHFTHPRDGPSAASSMPLCKFNPCTRVGCPFRHVPGATGSIGHHKSLILNSGHKPKTSERFAGGIVDDGEVEKLHVPASAHWANGGVSHQPNQQRQQGQSQLDDAAIRAAEVHADAEMDMDMDVIL
ncbi:hypothetical protein EDD21DRAFT_377510 [Dissophora ornata]|nr:hypothetical protein EDD21DRAFT_377510 [Dissophora ornata]